ncbi:MAG TPA: hypothetical protein PLX41_11810 [Bacteroidales bacterium]|nr:hypothetical protein [Bacteroidales bacterium]
MAIFKFNTQTLETSELDEYHFRSEGIDKVSPQEILAKNPELVLTIPELELPPSSNALVLREFSTNRGSIDILMVTDNADILLIETKLYRNPESHRTVVAQAIDYVKSFSDTNIEALQSKFLQSKYSDRQLAESLFKKEDFCLALQKNIRNGYYKVLIIGDKIRSNILGMVESIHSAPHLSFTLFLVELSPMRLDDHNIILEPRIVENTTEIERSVIRLEVDLKKETYIIESSAPSKESKGSRPIITEDQYINSLSNPSYAKVIKSFWTNWKSIGGDIKFGLVGFSAGMKIGDKRIPLQFIMNDKVDLISDNYRESYNISPTVYKVYTDKLKAEVPRAYDLVIANHVALSFELITESDLKSILDAAVLLALEMKGA